MSGPGPDGPARTYLDHAATTPMAPEAVAAMVPWLGGAPGNPSGSHADARRARRAVDDAREAVAALLGADLGEVVFTGSGTEADNLAVLGSLEARAAAGHHPGPLVCSAVEHHAVLHACRAAARRFGVELREVPADPSGLVDLEALAAACTPDVALVSVMAVNNETGAVQPLGRVAEVAGRRSPSAVLHTDAVQAAPWLDVAGVTARADLVVVSAHKFGGPQGVGVLVARRGTPLAPVTHGGGQERDRRSGTHNVAGIVATAAALAATAAGRDATGPRVAGLRDRLVDGLVAAVPAVTATGDRATTVPGIAHLRFAGVEGEALVLLLDEAGISASAGAACASGALEPSHVLVAMGCGPAEARSGLRFSFGPTSTDADVDRVVAAVPDLVARLRD